MKNQTKAIYINKFLRGFPDIFTKKEFVKYMAYLNCTLSNTEVDEIFAESPYLYQLDEESYITRAGVFAHRYFSVALTKEEIDAKCFLPGHRLIPFIDPEALSSTVTYCLSEKILPKKIVTFSKDFALKHFSLYGEEYESQYIAGDPGMIEFDLAAHDFELPAEVKLQCVDISEIFQNHDVKLGDRLLLKVIDWDECIITVAPLLRDKTENLQITKADIERQKWFKEFERTMLDVFDAWGPCASIEEQLSHAYFINLEALTKKNSGSIEEFLDKTKKIDFEFFGVETRLWKVGEEVPLFPHNLNPASNPEVDILSAAEKETVDFKRLDENFIFSQNDSGAMNVKNCLNQVWSVPDFILDEYIKNCAFLKNSNYDEIINQVFPSSFYLSEEDRKEFLLHIENRSAIILENYNWFADFQLGEIRKKALNLYSRVMNLSYEITLLGKKFVDYPQQELAIMVQLLSHLVKLVESLAFDPLQLIRDFETINLSLEGMDLNFEDIEPALKASVYECKKRDFKVIN